MLYFDCFKNKTNRPIVETGEVHSHFDNFGKEVFDINLNMSSIWSKLICEAGRFCDSYASDLLIDIDTVRNHIDKWESGTFFFGFRDMGVDHNAYIKCRSPIEVREYRAIWKLELLFEDDDYYEKKITATLNQVYYSTTDHQWMQMTVK